MVTPQRWAGAAMVRFERVGVHYPGRDRPVLADLDLGVPEGELCLVLGGTGSGKSTLLRCVNGLVPHFTGGRLSGRVRVAGRDTRDHPPRELADVVGYVGQDPLAGFVADVVEDELAYGMESLGVPGPVMRRRVEEVLDLLGLAGVRDRPLLSLSAGQQQRVAIGSVLTMQPRVLVLDEPTSALDPGAAEDVLAALTRLVHDLGLTVVVAEHRLERVAQYADSALWLRPDAGAPVGGPPAEVLARASVVPPVVQLGRELGWRPPALSVRDARRRAAEVRERLAGLADRPRAARPAGEVVARTRRLRVDYAGRPALRGVDLDVRAGEVLAVMGRNGAGKSTVLACLAGLRRPTAGVVETHGRTGLVPHRPADLLYAETVAAECRAADRDAAAAAGATAALLARLDPGLAAAAHPRDLSEGQRLLLALAVVLAAAPRLVLLDEPTRGLDYPAKARLGAVLGGLAAAGHAVVVVTHDVELAAELADRTVVLADGEVVTDAPTTDVLTASPAFAPQVAKVFAPLPVLTVGDVTSALAAAGRQ